MSFPIKQFIKNAQIQRKSQEYIETCLAYINKLQENNFPVIFSVIHLSILMGIQSNFLTLLIGESKVDGYKYFELKSSRYKKFLIKKKRKGYREIMAPSKDLKYIQKWILVNILSKHKLSNSCKGFRVGVSIYDNAIEHESATTILKIDLLKFYDTITDRRVYGVFKKMGYASNLSYSLAKLCTFSHGKKFWDSLLDSEKKIFSYYLETDPPILPQGAPTSPMLANIIATHMDFRFEKLGEKMNFKYTRYADDLTFSIKKEGILPSINFIKRIINEEGFFVNDEKTSFMKSGMKQYVTGLTTTNGVNISKKTRKEIFMHIHYCRKFGVESHLNYRKSSKNEFKNYSVSNYHDWLFGHICFINSINKAYSEKLLEDFKKINWILD
ncbi:reverse transcriptase family protein [uncultured Chryseobacterium sp.]|uniref:reverse transcriptase family protein n=1 Tax=uncultured Chryseobacterium sp. TaxID=259322 RepID=UPI0025D62D9B|nr:reverse transcriptase family protein [uncultured Chryseobacterium sp.]